MFRYEPFWKRERQQQPFPSTPDPRYSDTRDAQIRAMKADLDALVDELTMARRRLESVRDMSHGPHPVISMYEQLDWVHQCASKGFKSINRVLAKIEKKRLRLRGK